MYRRLDRLVLPVALAILIALATNVPAETPPGRGSELAQLDWMVGSWLGTKTTAGRVVRMEELWTEAAGGMMLGLHRDITADGRSSFEFLRITTSDEGIIYWASPSGREPTAFRLIESGPRYAVFANPDHDFPDKLTYRRDGDTLTARAEGSPDGKPMALEFRWQKR